MNTDPTMWRTSAAQEVLYNSLAAYLSCPTDDPHGGRLADRAACNYFVGKVFRDKFGIEDFTTSDGGWLLANQMAEYVASHPDQWSFLGLANDQTVLQNAAQGATNGQAVIALQRGSPGHVALVLPGAPQPSSKWKDPQGSPLKVPNSAAFSLDNPDGAYVFCRLSYGFSDPSKVRIFWRVR